MNDRDRIGAYLKDNPHAQAAQIARELDVSVSAAHSYIKELWESLVAGVVIPPFCEEIEEGLLGSILVDPGVLPAVREIIKEPGDFHIEANRAVYAAMCRLDDDSLTIDVRTVCAMLPKEIVSQTRDPLGDGEYDPRLTRYLLAVPAMTTLSYARIVRGLKVRRLALMAMERCLPHIINWQTGKPISETLGLLIDYLTDLRGCSAAQQDNRSE